MRKRSLGKQGKSFVGLCFFLLQVGILSAVTFRIEDRGDVIDFDLALDELHVTDANKFRHLEKIPVQASLAALQQHARTAARVAGSKVELVLYESGKPRDELSRRILTQRATVQITAGGDAKKIAKAVGASVGEELSYAPGFYIFETSEVGGVMALVGKLRARGDVVYAQPVLERKMEKKFVPNDPLFPQQWHLLNTGQNGALPGIDIHVTNVWNVYRGSGVVVGVVDDGVEYTHPDLAPNYNSTIDYDYRDGDADPFPSLSQDAHGTSVAGVAAARGNNSIGVSGVAFESTLVGIRLIGGFQTDEQDASALSHSNQVIHVKNNSWGPSDNGTTLGGAGVLALQALQNGAATGRNGRGEIFVWAGGNGAGNGDNVNYDNYANSIYTIAVGALNDLGRRTTYSEPGACLVVSAPAGGDMIRPQAISTADLTGDFGFNTSSSSSDYSDRDYTRIFNGTSAVSPVVSGVVALLLQANPNLGWRDVQEILMRTARRNDSLESGWFFNGAGFHFNHNYGAGLVDAEAAVNLGSLWRNRSTATNVFSAQSGLSIVIPDNNATGIAVTFDLTNSNLRVEHVTLTVTIGHPYRGDLEITLTSPAGTTSRLAERHNDSSDNYSNYKFMTVFNWGEISRGTWTARIADRAAADVGTLNAIRLDVFGTAPTRPVLRNPRYLPEGSFTFLVDDEGGRTHWIQASGDLNSWTTIATTNVFNGSYQFTDASAGSFPYRFYRVAVP